MQKQLKKDVSEGTQFKSEHNLAFEVAPWVPLPGFPPAQQFMKFRVGACEGLWRSTPNSFDILAITNNKKGNGHFNDVLQWFEHSCRRDKKVLRILEVWNKKFKQHLINKKAFKDIGNCNVEKLFLYK